MEKERKPLNEREIEDALSEYRRRGLRDEVLSLIEDDLHFGLNQDEICSYALKKQDFKQMKMYSKALRNGYGKEEISVLCADGMSAQQMALAFEFYEKGISLDVIRDVISESGNVPYRMKQAFEKIMEKQKELNGTAVTDEEHPYVSRLLEQITDLLQKIQFQDERYDELNKRLKELGRDESIRQSLIDQNTEKDEMLESQQDELNKANTAIMRLRSEKDKLEKEMEKMRERIKELEEKTAENQTDIKTTEAAAQAKTYADTAQSIPVYYQVPVLDENRRVVSHVVVDTDKKKTNGVIGTLARLCFKKKSRADIVKLVASGDLVPAQLVQIKNGITRGLTESQLVELINNNVSAEKMKEIIEIAVLENAMIQ